MSVTLSLQIPRGFAAVSAASNIFMLTLRAFPAGVLLSLIMWLLREAFAAYRRL